VHDVAFVVADGLSALAICRHAVPFLQALLPRLRDEGWQVAPLTLVSQGRVAVADEVGQLLRARLVVILIGERPGLSSPDSMGLYLTWMPRVGLSDANRNCISNVRPAQAPLPDDRSPGPCRFGCGAQGRSTEQRCHPGPVRALSFPAARPAAA